MCIRADGGVSKVRHRRWAIRSRHRIERKNAGRSHTCCSAMAIPPEGQVDVVKTLTRGARGCYAIVIQLNSFSLVVCKIPIRPCEANRARETTVQDDHRPLELRRPAQISEFAGSENDLASRVVRDSASGCSAFDALQRLTCEIGTKLPMMDTENSPDRAWTILFVCWLLVAGATLGSLFFSEIMELPPCSLCWVQRVFMFPLAIILLVGLFPLDLHVIRYALPLALGGAGVALYHTLLQLGIIPESAAPCRQGVSCTDMQMDLFGFVSIPMLSLLVFSAVAALLLVLRRSATP